MKKILTALALGASAVFASGAADAATLDQVKQKGFLQCGVSTGLPGFSNPDSKGEWTGLDVDLCRAVAAAIFDDPSKVRFSPLTAKDRFTALQSGEVDILSRNSTWTLSRDATQGLNFTATNYYDGQGFLVRKSLGVKSAMELNGASVCTQSGTTTELNVADFFRSNNLQYEVVAFQGQEETLKAYESGRCEVFTSDQSQLYALRLKLADKDEHVILPELISKEPLATAVRQGDDQWFDIVKWVHYGMLNAEEAGITSQNVKDMLNSPNPDIKRMLGAEGNFGEQIGLTKDWLARIVTKVGNYGEAFDRSVGKGSPLQIERGKNALWSKGGLQYGPPIR
ncbi:amino acid ABC transporter substrate-binding protein [Methylopila sp. Yamaguchi]|uniref:amino acid ABC transporter substrate-binding protein n=1 Tax=Methylopila sp. Yamaguchi TaxID=1437817 RepID=UPI000CB08732|nr:amino acid ABC transporter substrate-binding protein [Methylopila sp. Yamaguchi]GBD47331.1 extracellular solute-binding protein family 3 [Methylopila sp. Yamaguchi]